MCPDSTDGLRAPSDGGQMTADAVLSYLADRGAGVLSLAGDPPYSVPMSFAVDDSSGRLVFQSLSGPDHSPLGADQRSWARTVDCEGQILGALEAGSTRTARARRTVRACAPGAARLRHRGEV